MINGRAGYSGPVLGHGGCSGMLVRRGLARSQPATGRLGEWGTFHASVSLCGLLYHAAVAGAAGCVGVGVCGCFLHVRQCYCVVGYVGADMVYVSNGQSMKHSPFAGRTMLLQQRVQQGLVCTYVRRSTLGGTLR
jgi:hypothetical protein